MRVTAVLLISTMALGSEPVCGLRMATRPNSPAVRGFGGVWSPRDDRSGEGRTCGCECQ